LWVNKESLGLPGLFCLSHKDSKNGVDDLTLRIQLAKSIKELGELYKNNIYLSKDEQLIKLFSEKKASLVNQFSNLKTIQNGQ